MDWCHGGTQLDVKERISPFCTASGIHLVFIQPLSKSAVGGGEEKGGMGENWIWGGVGGYLGPSQYRR